MVHHSYGGHMSEETEQDNYAPRRFPFQFDNVSIRAERSTQYRAPTVLKNLEKVGNLL